MNLFKKIKAVLQYRKMVSIADMEHYKDGDRYYAIPTTGGNIQVVNRRTFRTLKHKKYIPHKANIIAMEKESFYHTSYANGTGKLSPVIIDLKKRQFYDWFDQTHDKFGRPINTKKK